MLRKLLATTTLAAALLFIVPFALPAGNLPAEAQGMQKKQKQKQKQSQNQKQKNKSMADPRKGNRR